MQVRPCAIGASAIRGWDLLAPLGTPVHAIRDGRVIDLRDSRTLGKQLTLRFALGSEVAYAVYAHLSEFARVKGEWVAEDTVLGWTGRSGSVWNIPAGDEHLHFEIRRQRPRLGASLVERIDPAVVLGHDLAWVRSR